MRLTIYRISKIPRDDPHYLGSKLKVETSVGVSTCYVLQYAHSWDFGEGPNWDDLDEALTEFLEGHGWRSLTSLYDYLREHNIESIERAVPPSLWDHLDDCG